MRTAPRLSTFILSAGLLMAPACASAQVPVDRATEQKREIEARQAERDSKANAEAARQDQEVRRVIQVPGDASSAAGAIQSALRGSPIRVGVFGDSVILAGTAADVQRAEELLSELRKVAIDQEMYQRDRVAQLRKMEQVRREELMRAMDQATPITERVFDVDLGPTLSASLKAVAEALATNGQPGINVVWMGSDSFQSVPVRPVQLRRVTLASALETLEKVATTNGSAPVSISLSSSAQADDQQAARAAELEARLRTQADAEAKALRAGMQVELPVLQDLPLLGMRFTPEIPIVTVGPVRTDTPGAPMSGARVAVFRTSPVPADAPPADAKTLADRQAAIMDAIDTGLSMMKRSPDFKVKLHAPTGMIFVYGSPEEIQLVEQVLAVAETNM